MNKGTTLLAKIQALSTTAKVAIAIGSVAVIGTTAVTVNHIVEDQKERAAIQEVLDTIETAMEKTFTIEDSTILVEYGNPVSTDVNDYVQLSEELMKEIVFELDIENETDKDYPAVGAYTGTIAYKDATMELKIEVKDTTAPEFTKIEDKYTFTVGDETVNLKDSITVSDLSETSLEIKGEYDINTVGEYEVEAIASDIYKNSTSKKVTVNIIEKTISNNISGSAQYEQCSGNICGGSTDGWTPPADFPINGNTTYGRPENYTTTPGQVYVGIDPYTGGTIYKLYGVENPNFDDGTMTIENNPSRDGRYTYVPPRPDQIPSHAIGNSGKVFVNYEEAKNWAREQVFDENSQWYGKQYVLNKVSTDSTVEESDPVTVYFN